MMECTQLSRWQPTLSLFSVTNQPLSATKEYTNHD